MSGVLGVRRPRRRLKPMAPAKASRFSASEEAKTGTSLAHYDKTASARIAARFLNIVLFAIASPAQDAQRPSRSRVSR